MTTTDDDDRVNIEQSAPGRLEGRVLQLIFEFEYERKIKAQFLVLTLLFVVGGREIPVAAQGREYCCPVVEPLGARSATARCTSTIARKRKAAGFRNTRTPFRRKLENRNCGEIIFY